MHEKLPKRTCLVRIASGNTCLDLSDMRRSFCHAVLSGCSADKAVFKGLSKVVTRFRLLRLVIGLKINLLPVYQPMRSKTNRPLYAWIFLRFEQVTVDC